jgi:hypothetical protein
MRWSLQEILQLQQISSIRFAQELVKGTAHGENIFGLCLRPCPFGMYVIVAGFVHEQLE